MTLETLAQKGSFLTTIIGDFDAKSCKWYTSIVMIKRASKVVLLKL